MNKKSVIGILGGMGPQASAYLYKLLIDLSIRDFSAKNNNDFPEIILYSIPIPDFISSDKDRDDALFMLRDRVEELNKFDISCLAIACNTVHVLLSDLQKASRVPFISMIDEIVKKVKKDKKKKVGLLAPPSTIRYKLYQLALDKENIETIVPESRQIKIFEEVARNVLKGKILANDTKKLVNVANVLQVRGAEGIILGCTELPLVFPKKYTLPVYSSPEILANALLQKYYKQHTMEAI